MITAWASDHSPVSVSTRELETRSTLITRRTRTSFCESETRCGSTTSATASRIRPSAKVSLLVGRSRTFLRSEQAGWLHDQHDEHQQQADDIGERSVIDRGDEGIHEGI